MSLKTIRAAVGESGANIPADVATVQYLLNCVPVSRGGPRLPLKIDGFAGVVTIEAINRFQNFHFGASNNRVESGDKTFGELKTYDPLPFSAPVVAPKVHFFNAEKMDPSKMNRGLAKSIEGGGIKAHLFGGIKDDSI
jgi:hypothetical protein